MRFREFMSICTILLLLSVASVQAQDQSGAVFGTITNENGAVISGAKVTVSAPVLLQDLTATTNNKGNYVFPALPVGKYSVMVSADSYTSARVDGVEISVGLQLRVNVTLKLGTVGDETVTIIADAPLIDLHSSDSGMTITREMFDSLPKGRDFTSLVQLAPGASEENIGRGLQIDGASASENVFVIDGLGTSSFYTGKSNQGVIFEFVDEVQVRSGGYEAEFGGSTGGVVNVVTRSGSEQYQGEVISYYTSDALTGDPRPILRINPVDDVTPEYITYPEDSYDTVNIGGSLGGYIFRDRLWFYTGFIPSFTSTERTVDFKTAANETYYTDTYEQNENTYNFLFKGTAQINERTRLNATVINDWDKWEGLLPSRDGSDNPFLDVGYGEQGEVHPGLGFTANLDYLLTDNLYMNVRAGVHMTDTNQRGVNEDILYRFYGNMQALYGDDPDFANIPDDKIVPNYYTTRPEQEVTEKDIQNKASAAVDLTYFADAMGSHTFKTGFQYNYLHNDIASAYTADYVYIIWGLTYTNSVTGVKDRGDYGFYILRTAHPDGRGTLADVKSHRYALYLQDSWAITDRLTINAGIRAEQEDLPSFSDIPEYSDAPIHFGFSDKLAPRIGFTYDLFGDGRTKVYANYGRYYDVMKLSMAQTAFGGYKWEELYFSLDTLEWWTIGRDSFGEWPRDDMSAYPGRIMGWKDLRVPTFDTIDPDVAPTSIDEFIIGGDMQLGSNTVLNSRIVYKRLHRLIETTGVTTEDGIVPYITNPGYGYSITKQEEYGYPGTPKAKRDYLALELRGQTRPTSNMLVGANVTFGRLEGNSSGLANTDDFGSARPNDTRQFDKWFAGYDANWNVIDGPLPTDRRWAGKMFATYNFDFGLTVGAYQIVQDGTPITTQFELNSFDSYMPYNRGDQGRYDVWTQTDIYAEFNFNLGHYRAQLNLNIINLFDEDNVWRKYVALAREEVRMSDQELYDTYHSGQSINVTELFEPYSNGRYDPRYMMDNGFQDPRAIRIGFKFFF